MQKKDELKSLTKQLACRPSNYSRSRMRELKDVGHSEEESIGHKLVLHRTLHHHRTDTIRRQTTQSDHHRKRWNLLFPKIGVYLTLSLLKWPSHIRRSATPTSPAPSDGGAMTSDGVGQVKRVSLVHIPIGSHQNAWPPSPLSSNSSSLPPSTFTHNRNSSTVKNVKKHLKKQINHIILRRCMLHVPRSILISNQIIIKRNKIHAKVYALLTPLFL